MYEVLLPYSLKVLLFDEQLDHALALSSLALSLTMYERVLSKLKARTMNSSLSPALMELDSPDISTLGGQSSEHL